MGGKTASLMRALSASFDQSPVTYECTNDLHRFCIEWGPTHWIYIPRSYLDDHVEQHLLRMLEHWRIAETLRSSQRSRCLLVGERGVLEVNANYGRRRD